MVNYQVKNSTDKPVKICISKGDKKEDHILASGEVRDMPKLAGATVTLPSPTDITLRQKRAISERFTRVARIVKEEHKRVVSMELPDLFVILKIKNVHEV